MPSNTSPQSHAAPARAPAVPRATARRPALADHSSEFPDVIAGRAPLLDSLLLRGSVGGRFRIFAGCTVELVRDFEFYRCAQTACLSILNCSCAFSPLDPHFPIAQRSTVRLSCVSGFLFVIQCRWFTIPDFVRSHSSLVSSFRILAAHSARLSVVLRLCVVIRFVVSVVGCCAARIADFLDNCSRPRVFLRREGAGSIRRRPQ